MAVNFSPETRAVLLPAIATCANDCYLFDKNLNLSRYAEELVEYRVEENGKKTMDSEVQYTVYRLKIKGEHEGKTVLAIRGTWTLQTLLQDLSLLDLGQVMTKIKFGRVGEIMGWKVIRLACERMINVAGEIKPDFITGHSLGGIIAEVVASFLRISGASFNSPGPVGLITETPFYNKDTNFYKGLEFEVHVRENDPISQINYEWHINRNPIWHKGSQHGSDFMAMDIQKDYSTLIQPEALSGIAGPLLSINKREEESKNSDCRILKWLFRNEEGCGPCVIL